jgi:hypothetical protein
MILHCCKPRKKNNKPSLMSLTLIVILNIILLVKKILSLIFCRIALISFILFFFSCAKKMLPPSPDRFRPHLLEINPVNRVRLDLVFDEDINISKLTTENFHITSVNGATLQIRTLGKSNNRYTISLFTTPTKPGQYLLSAIVEDMNNNVAQIDSRKFQSSTFIDTFAPKITSFSPKVGAIKRYKNILIDFTFSEPMDTTSTVNFIVTPLDKNKINWVWSKDWQNITFGYPDSLIPNTIVSFVLLPTLTDLENNRLDACGYTFFTTESILPAVLVSGNLFYQEKPFANGIVVFTSNSVKTLAVSDLSGNFSARLDSASYTITAIADTNHDGFVDLFAEKTGFNTTDTTHIRLNVIPILEGQQIDTYLRPVRNSK